MEDLSTHERGITASLAKKWILENYGKQGLGRILSRLGPEAAGMLSEPAPAEWYPIGLVKEIYSAIDDEFSGNDAQTLFEMGRFVAESSVKGFLRYLARMLTIEQLIKRVGRFWKHYHKGGSIESEQMPDEGGRKKGLVRIFGYQAGNAGCKAMEGYIHEILEIAGARDLKVKKTTCLNRGDEVCTWSLDWSDS
ncbi:hypothetical protein GF359_07960 [candidate division WOR-3 bacterium]|uniref:4-vinyl reductase 4VR domain-containing protein n=1 Tax=candidate division WOR-3 bacterium TaxID=2052148 RepID=A0A9D5KAI9_UNCW3|nr:hypothetical protein [candidate division WOR-3 bacterium]MBD3365135.1 hypothetical protein [candidate division WOR-3 bacterium]